MFNFSRKGLAMGRSDYSLGKIQLIFWIPINLQFFWKFHHGGQVCMCSYVGRINLHVQFYFTVFLTILYNTCETGPIGSSILLSPSVSCYLSDIVSVFNLDMRSS